jgi:hypothetical protein
MELACFSHFLLFLLKYWMHFLSPRFACITSCILLNCIYTKHEKDTYNSKQLFNDRRRAEKMAICAYIWAPFKLTIICISKDVFNIQRAKIASTIISHFRVWLCSSKCLSFFLRQWRNLAAVPAARHGLPLRPLLRSLDVTAQPPNNLTSQHGIQSFTTSFAKIWTHRSKRCDYFQLHVWLLVVYQQIITVTLIH